MEEIYDEYVTDEEINDLLLPEEPPKPKFILPPEVLLSTFDYLLKPKLAD